MEDKIRIVLTITLIPNTLTLSAAWSGPASHVTKCKQMNAKEAILGNNVFLSSYTYTSCWNHHDRPLLCFCLCIKGLLNIKHKPSFLINCSLFLLIPFHKSKIVFRCCFAKNTKQSHNHILRAKWGVLSWQDISLFTNFRCTNYSPTAIKDS